MFLHKIILQGHEAAGHAADAAGHGGGHSEGSTPHLQNIVGLIANSFEHYQNTQVAEFLNNNLNVIYSWVLMGLIVIFFANVAKKLKKIPGRQQTFAELIFQTLDSFVVDVLGPAGRTYVPLIGSIFIYIICMNLFGLVPVLGHSPSSSLNITLSIALVVFFTVQIHGIRGLGILGWLKHYAGISDKPHFVEYILAPLMVVLHTIGELAKPVSLSLRLFGNITGEDVLIAVFVTLVAFVPLQLFVYPIALLGSFIQALVFALLSTVYILLMSHAEEH